MDSIGVPSKGLDAIGMFRVIINISSNVSGGRRGSQHLQMSVEIIEGVDCSHLGGRDARRSR
ncbi:MAG: hypothetical protein WA517_13030 [Candidatus Acidiferrum sp.]